MQKILSSQFRFVFSFRFHAAPTLSSSSFRRASTPDQTQTGLGQGFIILLPQAALLPGSNAGSYFDNVVVFMGY